MHPRACKPSNRKCPSHGKEQEKEPSQIEKEKDDLGLAVEPYNKEDAIGLRVTEEEEREGLDIASHGETAYHG